MSIAVIGTSFHTAPLPLREAVAFRADEIPDQLDRIRNATGGGEVFLLATCNRTELYIAGDAASWSPDRLAALLLPNADSAAASQWRDQLYHYTDDAAVRHLMEVGTGLDSMVVGESEVFGQIKQAYAAARDAGTIGVTLQPIMEQAFSIIKRVRTETDISAGRISVASIAVNLISTVFDQLTDKSALVIGAGEVAGEALRNLSKLGLRDVCVMNRSLDRAQALAAHYDGVTAPLDRLAQLLPSFDVVVSSTSAPEHVMTTAIVKDAIRQRHGRPLLIVDLAVPRDVEVGVGDIPNVYLYNIDDLQGMANANLGRRKQAADAARELIEERASEIRTCSCASELAELMRALDRLSDDVSKTELTRAFSKKRVAPDDEKCRECREEIRIMIQRAIRKVLDEPRRALNDAAHNGDWEQISESVKTLFSIDREGDDDQR